MLLHTSPAPGVLELRLNRPGQLNALTMALAQALLAQVEQAMQGDAVRAIVLCGEGRAFCAGKDRDDPAGPEFVAVLQALAQALMDGPKPVVAAVQGWAVGAGLELLLNCDIVVAERTARFMLPEVRVGLFGTGGIAALLPRLIGMARAKGALMLGQEFNALQAEQWGLIWSLAEEGQARAHAVALAQQLAQSDPLILSSLKKLLHDEAVGAIAGPLAREAQVHATLANALRVVN